MIGVAMAKNVVILWCVCVPNLPKSLSNIPGFWLVPVALLNFLRTWIRKWNCQSDENKSRE